MADPATNPLHDLVDDPQDRPQPRIRLGTFLALLRVLAGRRGDATVIWHRDGFSYTLTAAREGGAPGVALDVDPEAPGGDVARARLLDALEG
jgi:hypothetical protein